MPLTFGVERPDFPKYKACRRVDVTRAMPAQEKDWPDAMLTKRPAGFPRSARLLRHADFERVYKDGRRHFSASLTVFYLARGEGDRLRPQKRADSALSLSKGVTAPHGQGLRVGFTVGRALGGAVLRNRMKRRLREAVRLTRPATGVAADIVINPKKSVLTVDFDSVLREMSQAFDVIGHKLSQKQSDASGRERTTRRAETGHRS